MLWEFVCPILPLCSTPRSHSTRSKSPSPKAGTESEPLIFPLSSRCPRAGCGLGRGRSVGVRERRGEMDHWPESRRGRPGGRGRPLPRRAPPTACAAHPDGGIRGGHPQLAAPSSGGSRPPGHRGGWACPRPRRPPPAGLRRPGGRGRVGRPARARGRSGAGPPRPPPPAPGSGSARRERRRRRRGDQGERRRWAREAPAAGGPGRRGAPRRAGEGQAVAQIGRAHV